MRILQFFIRKDGGILERMVVNISMNLEVHGLQWSLIFGVMWWNGSPKGLWKIP